MGRCYNSKLVFDKATTTMLSDPMSIGNGELLKFQIDSTASFSISVLGSVASGMEYKTIKIINDLDNSETTSVTEPGNYVCLVSGLFAVKFEITSISGGDLSLFAKSINIIEIKKNGGGGGGGDDPYVLPPATKTTLGGIKVGSNLSITNDGVLSATGGSGTSNYEDLINLPSINGIELIGNVNSADLNLTCDKSYVYTQNVESDTWNITHNMCKYTSVFIIDDDGKAVIADIYYINLNKVRLNFSQPMSGKAALN